MIRRSTLILAAALLALPAVPQAKATKAATVCAACIKAHVEHLAAPALNGRRCATADEARAADYLIGEMKKARVSGGLPGGGYLQTVDLERDRAAGPAELRIGSGASLIQNQDFLVLNPIRPLAGPVLRITDPAHPPAEVKGSVVFIDAAVTTAAPARALVRAGAVATVEIASPATIEHWDDLKGRDLATRMIGDSAGRDSAPMRIILKPAAAEALRATATPPIALAVSMQAPLRLATHNVVGVIHGSLPDADQQAVLLSAHYDHLGLRDGKLYPGANDDASGTAAVLEFARVLKAGVKPKRTVFFALFGCEEEGGFGARWFDSHPPVPVTDLVANIEFEMIGFRDPNHPEKLMMTGYERSNLGPTLAEHGARIEQDPYPEQNFFQRSDNYALARVGVVAHTISAWPTPPTYHQPTDTAASVDYAFMAQAAASLVEPVRWLLNADFRPAWNPGGKP